MRKSEDAQGKGGQRRRPMRRGRAALTRTLPPFPPAIQVTARGGTPLYGLYRYVRLQRVGFFSRFGYK